MEKIIIKPKTWRNYHITQIHSFIQAKKVGAYSGIFETKHYSGFRYLKLELHVCLVSSQPEKYMREFNNLRPNL
jgi:hypothetical protein